MSEEAANNEWGDLVDLPAPEGGAETETEGVDLTEGHEEQAEVESSDDRTEPATEGDPEGYSSPEQPTAGRNEESEGEGGKETRPEEQHPILDSDDHLDDVSYLRNQLSSALGELAQLKSKFLQGEGKPQQEEVKPQVQAQAQAQPQAQEAFRLEIPKDSSSLTSVDFIGDQDLEDLLLNKEKLNTLLNKVATATMNATRAVTQETILRQIPDVVAKTANQQIEIARITEDFYKNNNDLKNYKEAVSMAALQIYQENPNLQTAELLARAAERTREVLRFSGGRRTRTPAKPAGSGKAGQSRTNTPTRTLSPMEQTILDLISDD